MYLSRHLPFLNCPQAELILPPYGQAAWPGKTYRFGKTNRYGETDRYGKEYRFPNGYRFGANDC